MAVIEDFFPAGVAQSGMISVWLRCGSERAWRPLRAVKADSQQPLGDNGCQIQMCMWLAGVAGLLELSRRTDSPSKLLRGLGFSIRSRPFVKPLNLIVLSRRKVQSVPFGIIIGEK